MWLNWFEYINLRLEKLLKWPLENIWKVSPWNFTVGSNRQSIVQWGNEEFMCECLSQQKLFLNQQSLFIHVSMCFWSKQVLLEYINIWQLKENIIYPSPVQYARLFLWDSTLMFPSVTPIVHGPVSLCTDDKFRSGHQTTYKQLDPLSKNVGILCLISVNQVPARKMKTILGN